MVNENLELRLLEKKYQKRNKGFKVKKDSMRERLIVSGWS